MLFIPEIEGNENKTSYEINPKKIFFESENNYDFLIICPKYFARLVKLLVKHKEKYGIKTYLATLNDIYSYENSYLGRDKPEKIKLFIKDAIENWGIKYVLLIGGKIGQTRAWHLPVRYIYLGNDWESKVISDLYYADIYDSNGDFCSWDLDEDGKFGEWFYNEQPEDRFIDLAPDVSIGRLPCRNRLEVRLVIHKIITYENKNHKTEPWFYNMIVAAGDTYPEKNNPNWVDYEGEFYGDRAIENMTSFNPIRLYTSDGSLTHWKDILKPMNNGAGFVYFVGHGCPMLWTNNFPNGTGRVEPFSTFQIARLRNKNKLPVVVVSGCHNLQFDVTIFNFFNKTKRYNVEYVPECWGWQMTRKIGGGSIATI
ncbi:MAG: C25 family cysteine peptidase, partial [Thermoplasmatota archaeon]